MSWSHLNPEQAERAEQIFQKWLYHSRTSSSAMVEDALNSRFTSWV